MQVEIQSYTIGFHAICMTWDVHIFLLKKKAYFHVTFNQVAVHNSQEHLEDNPTKQTLGKQFNMNYVCKIFKRELNCCADNTACSL